MVVRFRQESPIVTPTIAEDLLSILQRPRHIDAADQRLRVATADALAVVLTTIAEVQDTYLAVRAIDDELAVFAERQKLIARLSEVARSRRNAGEGTRLDVLTLDVQRIRLEGDIADKQLERSAQRLLLARLLGRPSSQIDWTLAPWESPATVPGAEGAWIRAALDRRPEVQAKRWELAALGDEATLARWARG